jgi:hypothetical protein
MYVRSVRSGFALLAFTAALIGCASSGLDSITVAPATQTLSVGQTVQYTVTGTFGNAKHPSTQVITSGVSWTSSNSAVATINATGLATAVGAGTTTISANTSGYNGPVSAVALLTVTASNITASGGGTAGGTMQSLTIIPDSISVGNLQETGQFLAIGTFSTPPAVRDLTNSVQWISTAPGVFPVGTNNSGLSGQSFAGLATAYGIGNATIVAKATDTNGSILTATATFACPFKAPTATDPGTCYPGSEINALLSTLTVYNEGLNTTNWIVTAPSGTGTPNVIHCGPGWGNGDPTQTGGSVCKATYAVTQTVGTKVVLTAPSRPGVKFGGWSYNCTPSDANGNPIGPPFWTEAGPNYCTFTFQPAGTTGGNSNMTVGAIFN